MSIASPTPAPSLDLKDPAVVQDPFPTFHRLRSEAPVFASEALGGWVLTRHDDVLRVFRDDETFSSDRFRRGRAAAQRRRPAVEAVAAILREWLVFRDPPDHTRLRGLLHHSFTPRTLAASRPRIAALVEALVARARAAGRVDLIAELAFPLPAMVIATLLGAPIEEIDAIKRWSDQLSAYLGGGVGDGDNFATAEAGARGLWDYFDRLLARRRRTGEIDRADDLMGLMLRAEAEGDRLAPEEIVSNCVLLLFAGHETTTNLIGNGLLHLLERPDAWARLERAPSRVSDAVEELLRFDSPVTATIKVATRDFEWRGRSIAAGDAIIPMLSAANRDPEVFVDPDRLDLDRPPGRGLAFGHGIHFCLGAPLARLEAELAFTALLRDAPTIALVGPRPRFRPQLFLRGLERLDVAF